MVIPCLKKSKRSWDFSWNLKEEIILGIFYNSVSWLMTILVGRHTKRAHALRSPKHHTYWLIRKNLLMFRRKKETDVLKSQEQVFSFYVSNVILYLQPTAVVLISYAWKAVPTGFHIKKKNQIKRRRKGNVELHDHMSSWLFLKQKLVHCKAQNSRFNRHFPKWTVLFFCTI